MEWTNTRDFILKYANSVESEIETRLHNRKKIASGHLYDSIGYKLSENKDRFKLEFFMADYGKYVDKGTKPSKYAHMKDTRKRKGRKSKFIEALMKWCRIRGIPKEAAFPIRRKIWKEGQAPTNFFTIPTTRRLKQFESGVEKMMAKDIELAIQKELDGN
jgi:hypothetical protein